MKKRIKAPKVVTKQKTLTKKVQFKKSETILVTVPAVTLKNGQKFKTFKEIAALFATKSNPYHTFVYIGKTATNADVALWGVNLDPNKYWYNRFDAKGKTLLESKATKESRADFLKRIRKNLDYDADQLRLTFARVKNRYYFIGVYQLSIIDVDSQTVIYKKVADKLDSVFYKRMTRTLDVTIEETEELTEGMIFV